MPNRTGNRIIDTESIRDAAREWGWAYALLFSSQSLAYILLILWFGITDPQPGGFFPNFMAILRNIGIAGLASIVITTTILEGWETIMILSAAFKKARDRRIREEAFAEGRAEGREEGRAEAEEILALERAAWQAWLQRSELARERGEEPPPPPVFGASNGR